jgi:membrane-bound lytic murein transglycosylase F
MLTLKTAKDLKIKNRLDPESSIIGGTRYFKKTLDRIDESIPEPDRTWMAMAAYNVGYYHLQDAREITRKLNKDPNRWIDVRQALPLLAQRKWYKDTRYGYARGWEPVRYVENIRSYYDILKWVDEGDDELPPAPEEFLKIPNSL